MIGTKGKFYGKEGKFYARRCYVSDIDRWDWFATCWIGDRWYSYQSYTLATLCDFLIMKYKGDASL